MNENAMSVVHTCAEGVVVEKPRRPDALFWIAISILVAVAGVTRLPAPWRLEIINDEAHHHLESYRNRYRTSNIYPMFLERLEGRISPGTMEWVRKIYHSSTLAQRAMIVLIDPQPPLYPVMAEVIEAVTHSSLTALRLPSVVASLLAIYLMFLCGREMRDWELGLLLASLMTIGALAQIFAGIGRPYAVAQASLLLAIYAFVLDRRHVNNSPWRFLLAVLVAQVAQWMIWAVVGPLVAAALVVRWQGGRSIGWLFRKTWWYGLASLALLAEMMVQLQNPTISKQAGARSLGEIWRHMAMAGPFAHLASFGNSWLHLGGLVIVVAAVIGLFFLVRGKGVSLPTYARVGIIAAAGTSLLAAIVLGSGLRFSLTYIMVPTLLVGIGFRSVLSGRTSIAASMVMLVGFGCLSIYKPLDPYRFVFDDTPYSVVAERLKLEMKPGDTWVSYPYFRANCLYRYGSFPEPIMPYTFRELERIVAERDRSNSLFILTSLPISRLTFLEGSNYESWSYLNDFSIIELPDTDENTPSPPP